MNITYLEKRNRREKLLNIMTYLISGTAILIFTTILFFIFSKGLSLVNFDLLLGDSSNINTDIYVQEEAGSFIPPADLESDIYFSENWGIALSNSTDKEGHEIVVVSYVDEKSPFMNAIDKNGDLSSRLQLPINATVETAFLDNGVALGKFGAQTFVGVLDKGTTLTYLTIQKSGGGIRGSLITTLYLILLTLVLAVPFGVATAIYLNEYNKHSRSSKIMRLMIETLTGVPSIVYGLMGAAVFIPFSNKIFGTNGGSIISGALTMSIILLPVIIKSTEEALKVIPDEVRNASFALGASKTQTIFKVIIPTSIPGILSGVLLGVGRIIGESAALIYAIGAVVKDQVVLTERSTTLAVHIWTAMGGETPNFELASAIAIIILAVVVILSFIIKIITNRLNQSWY